mgnify:CR=1 FL=1
MPIICFREKIKIKDYEETISFAFNWAENTSPSCKVCCSEFEIKAFRSFQILVYHKSMKKRFVFWTSFYSLLSFAAANSFLLLKQELWFLAAVIPAFLLVNLAGIFSMGAKGRTLRLCSHGTVLLHVFIISITLSVAFHMILPFLSLYEKASDYWLSVLFCVICHFVIFWNGMLCVYCSSVQLGLKHRLIGIFCGMIPIVNLFALNHILRITYREVDFELTKQKVNRLRADKRLCATKYPILLVHGVFFRDSAKFNYWGRI